MLVSRKWKAFKIAFADADKSNYLVFCFCVPSWIYLEKNILVLIHLALAIAVSDVNIVRVAKLILFFVIDW
jgi:hypothetical protein